MVANGVKMSTNIIETINTLKANLNKICSGSKWRRETHDSIEQACNKLEALKDTSLDSNIIDAKINQIIAGVMVHIRREQVITRFQKQQDVEGNYIYTEADTTNPVLKLGHFTSNSESDMILSIDALNKIQLLIKVRSMARLPRSSHGDYIDFIGEAILKGQVPLDITIVQRLCHGNLGTNSALERRINAIQKAINPTNEPIKNVYDELKVRDDAIGKLSVYKTERNLRKMRSHSQYDKPRRFLSIFSNQRAYSADVKISATSKVIRALREEPNVTFTTNEKMALNEGSLHQICQSINFNTENVPVQDETTQSGYQMVN